MQNEMNSRPPLDDRRTGMGGGTIAAIIAALLIVGALFTWGPWSGSHTTANNTPGMTTGSASTTRPAAPVTAPVTAPAPATTR
jgi:hypothetical protein